MLATVGFSTFSPLLGTSLIQKNIKQCVYIFLAIYCSDWYFMTNNLQNAIWISHFYDRRIKEKISITSENKTMKKINILLSNLCAALKAIPCSGEVFSAADPEFQFAVVSPQTTEIRNLQIYLLFYGKLLWHLNCNGTFNHTCPIFWLNEIHSTSQ